MTTTTQTDMTVKELRTEAATLGIKGRSKMTKAQLLDALEARDARLADAYEVADIVEPGATDSSPLAALVRSLKAATAQLGELATIPVMAAEVGTMATRLLAAADAL